MSNTGVFAIPQNLKKKSKKGKSTTGGPGNSGAPIVLELALEQESGLYMLEFAGRKCKNKCIILIDPEV